MLFGLLSFLFAMGALLIILLILIQKGKGSMGLGNIGGGNQMLFGGGGGQDLFQKITWFLGSLLILGSLGLAIWKAKNIGVSTALLRRKEVPTQPAPAPTQPSMPEPKTE